MNDLKSINLASYKQASMFAEVASQIYSKSSDKMTWYTLLEDSGAHEWNWDEGLSDEGKIYTARALDAGSTLIRDP